MQAGGERERVLHRELGARSRWRSGPCARRRRAGRRCRGARSALRIVVKLIHRELLASTSCPSSDVGEQLLDRLDRLLVGLARGEGRGPRTRRSRPPPDRVVHLDDERAAGRVVRVAVDLHHAERRLAHVELEGVEDLGRCRATCTCRRGRPGRPERVGVPGPDGGVEPVAGDHQVVRREPARRRPVPRCGSASRRRARGTAPAGSASSRLRGIAAKPCPPLVIDSPR